jgi:hypothetical protein
LNSVHNITTSEHQLIGFCEPFRSRQGTVLLIPNQARCSLVLSIWLCCIQGYKTRSLFVVLSCPITQETVAEFVPSNPNSKILKSDYFRHLYKADVEVKTVLSPLNCGSFFEFQIMIYIFIP